MGYALQTVLASYAVILSVVGYCCFCATTEGDGPGALIGMLKRRFPAADDHERIDKFFAEAERYARCKGQVQLFFRLKVVRFMPAWLRAARRRWKDPRIAIRAATGARQAGARQLHKVELEARNVDGQADLRTARPHVRTCTSPVYLCVPHKRSAVRRAMRR